MKHGMALAMIGPLNLVLFKLQSHTAFLFPPFLGSVKMRFILTHA